MQLHNLKRKNKNKRSVNVGRGGKRGKTSGRGTKGQNARAGRKKRPEIRDLIQRLPRLRGRGVSALKSRVAKPYVLNLSLINETFSNGDNVSPKTISESGLSSGVVKIKILGNGEISKKIIVSGCMLSASARDKILKAGGEIK